MHVPHVSRHFVISLNENYVLLIIFILSGAFGIEDEASIPEAGETEAVILCILLCSIKQRRLCKRCTRAATT